MPPCSFAPPRVLLVGDNGSARALTLSMLHLAGFGHSVQAAAGSDVLEELALGTVDLVLAEWLMTSLSGLELTRRIRASRNPRLATVPVVLLSAHADRRLAEAARQAGVSRLLVRPISINGLKQGILATWRWSARPLTRDLRAIREFRQFP